MEGKIVISKMFPNYHLSKEEADWVRSYIRHTNFDLIEIENVKDRASFVAMMRYNIEWFKNWGEETWQQLESGMTHLSYYTSHVLKHYCK